MSDAPQTPETPPASLVATLVLLGVLVFSATLAADLVRVYAGIRPWLAGVFVAGFVLMKLRPVVAIRPEHGVVAGVTLTGYRALERGFTWMGAGVPPSGLEMFKAGLLILGFGVLAGLAAVAGMRLAQGWDNDPDA